MSDKKFIPDYTLVCRTCLQSNEKMINLSAHINENIRNEYSKISYMDCLKMCVQVEDIPDIDMPKQICLECASVMQVSYCFMKNASQAQELLKLKLREIGRKKQQIEKELHSTAEDVKKAKRFRCKICNVKVETKRSLKDHVKLHLDIIAYNCQLCSYESNNRNSLSEHYIQIHCVEASNEQLKPKTKLFTNFSTLSSAITAHDPMEGAIKNELFQILPEDPPQIVYEEFTEPTTETNSLCNLGNERLSTIITSDLNYATISAAFNDTAEKRLSNDLNIGNEFVLMDDGSIEKVIKKDVVIEYINAENNNSKLTLDNGFVLDNIMQVQNINNTVMLQQQNDIGQMDVDDLIIEDRSEIADEVPAPVILCLEEETIPINVIEQPKKLMCKICTKDFLTQEQLKNHMLTHNEIPHFFCDQCTFYTFFKIDLHQHYKSKHNLQPTNKQLQPRNKQKIINEVYACDLCFYESEAKSDLKTHYRIRHKIEAKEIHLKPTKVEKYRSYQPSAMVNKATKETSKDVKYRSNEKSTPDYPNGLNCRKCNEVFYFRNKLYEHYKMHNAEEAALKKVKQLAKIQNKPYLSSNLYKNNTKIENMHPVQIKQETQTQLKTSHTSSFSSLNTFAINVTASNVTTLNSKVSLTSSSSSTYTLPLDAIPQIVETDHTIENDMDFYFNCADNALFEDFNDDVDVENESDDNNEWNVLLTSDDDFEDILQKQNCGNNPSTTELSCAHCQKRFISQYQYENHMFIHRGLAPYRCELCTNLYNTKRCLIRHYKAVHKNVPSRDMIQAKGDKVFDDKTPPDLLKLEPTTCFMCAKCPYEATESKNIKFHLNSSHNIVDDSFIMNKLPYECPRCIRSFESKVKLLRHLDRNHSSVLINKYQARFGSVKNISTTGTSTSVTPITEMTMKTESIEIAGSSACNNSFIKQEQQYKQQRYALQAAPTENKVVFKNAHFKEFTSHKISQSAYNGFSTNSHITTMSFTSPSIVPTPLDDNDLNQPLFKCKVCLITCYNLTTFNEHCKSVDCRKINANSPDDKILFECEICRCYYKTMYLLKHHLKRHISRKFLCIECPKTFINKVELEVHKHVHNGERPHKCDECTKSFRYVHHLKRHKDSVHFGKRHVCTESNCDRKFTTLAQLKVHIWSHNGIVPYKCTFCNRLFKKRLLLREHCLKIHKFNISEVEMAEIFRNRLGYTNPYDFTVTTGNGKMLRRGDMETLNALGVVKSSLSRF